MKRAKLVFVLLSSMLLFMTSCEKSELISGLEESEIQWQQFKVNHSNSYEYLQTTKSWSGWETAIQVKVIAGEIVERKYDGWMIEYPNNKADTTMRESWVEKIGEINSHEAFEKAQTLESIYLQAREYAESNNDGNLIIFESNNNGLVSKSGYIQKNCADDCFNGISITDIKGIKPSPASK